MFQPSGNTPFFSIKKNILGRFDPVDFLTLYNFKYTYPISLNIFWNVLQITQHQLLQSESVFEAIYTVTIIMQRTNYLTLREHTGSHCSKDIVDYIQYVGPLDPMCFLRVSYDYRFLEILNLYFRIKKLKSIRLVPRYKRLQISHVWHTHSTNDEFQRCANWGLNF